MLVVSPNVVLSPTAALGPNNPLFGIHSVVTTTNVAADFAADGFPASNLANPITAPGASWVGEEDEDPQYVTVTIDSVDELDYVGIAAHNFGSTGATVSVEVATETDIDDEPVWVEEIEPLIPATDDPMLFRIGLASYIGIRVGIVSGTEAPRAAVLNAGKLMIGQRRIYVPHVPITMGRSITVANGKSEKGNFLGRLITGESRGTSVPMQNLTPDWVREELDPFLVAAQELPFFFAWRPQTYPNEVGFCWLTNDPQPQNQRSNGMMQCDLQIGGIA